MVTLRRMTAADLPAILAIQQTSPEAAQWPAANWREFFCPEADISSDAPSAGSAAWTAWVAETAVGFLAAIFSGEELEVLNIAVLPDSRRKGIASQLLEAALAAARNSGALQVWLEVRASNTGAAAFYERNGFLPSGRRKNYYTAPREDAVVLSRMLSMDR